MKRRTSTSRLRSGKMALIARPMALSELSSASTAKLPMDEAARMSRMSEQGWGGGLHRGGAIPGETKTGAWCTPSSETAAEFARGYAARCGAISDVREYATNKKILQADKNYSPQLVEDWADLAANDGDGNVKVSKFLRAQSAGGDPFTRLEVWRVLSLHAGEGVAQKWLTQVGFGGVSGYRGQPGAPYVQLWERTPVRDVKRAKFDPSKSKEYSSIVAGAAGLGRLGLQPGIVNEP